MHLPVDDIIAPLREALAAHSNVVVHAPTGAGKTTRVPLALLAEPWLGGARIVMLEPRRVAARAAARYMAKQLGESVGETVGYRVRFDTKVAPQTRIEVVTEGVLTRLLQNDPELSGYGVIIFDEFHERSLQADLGLALDVQSGLRPELRLLVMSATLPQARVAAYLGDAPVIASDGRSYPVEVSYDRADRPAGQTLAARVASATERALRAQSGGVLVFLPGAAEIHKVVQALHKRVPPDVVLMPLYGALPHVEQDRAIAPLGDYKRKVVLATNIAETSLTIEGVRAVVDAGLVRVARFDPNSGMTRLVTTSVARDSAAQRAGRAGRVAPGICYRLWSESAHKRRPAITPPAMQTADLTPLLLELACWGVTTPTQLRWLDEPPAGAVEQAFNLLSTLGALSLDAKLTPHGREISRLPVHPRLAHMIVRAADYGGLDTAYTLAALLSEPDILPSRERTTDIQQRLNMFRSGAGQSNQWRLSGVRKMRRQLERQRPLRHRRHEAHPGGCSPGVLLAFAYPDRIAQKRAGSDVRYLLASGKGAILPSNDVLTTAPYLVVADLDGDRREARIYLAAELDADAIETHFDEQITVSDTVSWEADRDGVVARREHCLGALVLRQRTRRDITPARLATALVDGIRQSGSTRLPWTPALRQWQQRVMFLRAEQGKVWPAVDDDTLMATLEQWLQPYLAGVRRLSQLRSDTFLHALHAVLSAPQRRLLERLTPRYITAPTGSRIAIDYSASHPVLAVRLQELFGCTVTPTIMDGTVPLTLHLLSPAQRSVQITQDLANFWRRSYHDVKKDLKGRYPKHYWPDDPSTATPTRFTRRRK